MKRPNTHHIQKRATLVGAAFFCLLTVILGRAAYLQVFLDDFLAGKAAGQYEKTIRAIGRRGTIYDTRLRELAVSTDSVSLAAYPQRIAAPRQAAQQIARALNLPAGAVSKKLEKSKSFVWIKRHVSPREAESVRKLEIDGIDFIPEHGRYYPNRSLAAQLIGFSGIDGNGLEGIEFDYDRELRGGPVMFTVFRDARGRGFDGEREIALSQGGNNLVLTIDRTIQYITESALEAAVKSTRAKSGMAVVMVPATGEVLAMANFPLFNPNDFNKYATGQRRNRVVTDAFEPGSTVKIFSTAAALETGSLTPHSIFFCENGKYRLGKRTIHDTKPHGWLSLQRIVKHSSNIGTAKMAAAVGAEAIHDIYERFGFGQRTGIDCPGETSGYLGNHEKWTPFDTAAKAFGQGMSVSAIQLVSAVAAVANGGILMKPYIVKAVNTPDGEGLKTFGPQTVRRAISPKTARAVTRMMRMAVEADGTGTEAELDGYTSCGKTGTAQKVDESGTYAKGKYVSSFAGFAPLERPELAVVVVIDEPREDHYGGKVAAPVFRRIAQDALTYLNVAPSPDAGGMTVSRETEIRG
ncbi:MAG: peptidoglycan D,D-transpeptidase FtsI family protein [Desulfobacterales bacterium]